MPKPRTPQPDTASRGVVHAIDPRGVYFPDDFRRLLRMREGTLRREVRAGRLRVSKRGGKYMILGAWLLEWIEQGELPPGRHQANGAGVR
jgi:hypothetical protein